MAIFFATFSLQRFRSTLLSLDDMAEGWSDVQGVCCCCDCAVLLLLLLWVSVDGVTEAASAMWLEGRGLEEETG